MRILLVPLALAALVAAKPGAPLGPEGMARYEAAAIALCAGDLERNAGFNSAGADIVCSCAINRFMVERDPGLWPALDGGAVPAAMRPDIARCIAERPAAVRPAPAAAADKPEAPAALPASPGPSLRERFDRMLARLDGTGLPRWAGAPLLVLALAFLRLIFGGRRRDDDLMGPPRSMRLRTPPRR